MPAWKVLGQKEQRWLGLMLDVVKGEQRVGRGSEAAKLVPVNGSRLCRWLWLWCLWSLWNGWCW